VKLKLASTEVSPNTRPEQAQLTLWHKQ